jgi:N-acetylmuramoyl-L-alanine amidase
LRRRRAAGNFARVKLAVAFALLLCALCGPAPAAPAAEVNRVTLGGKSYYRLDQWARANSYQWKWLSKNDLVVWNAARRMQFTADSKRMEFNGVLLLLSEAVREQNGVPYLAAIDLTTAINPLLYPPKLRAKAKVKHICIDAGHGGSDPGNMEGHEKEKRYTLLLAQELGAQLRKAGYTVSYTRTGDTMLDLPVRPDLARRRNADLFISLHFNAAGPGSSSVRGAETYCLTPAGASSTNARGEGASNRSYSGNAHNARNMVLAYEIQKAMVRDLKSEDRGVKRARFQVLRDATMPAVLIEGGFMTNPTEARNIYSAAWRARLATAITAGINSYRRQVES